MVTTRAGNGVRYTLIPLSMCLACATALDESPGSGGRSDLGSGAGGTANTGGASSSGGTTGGLGSGGTGLGSGGTGGGGSGGTTSSGGSTATGGTASSGGSMGSGGTASGGSGGSGGSTGSGGTGGSSGGTGGSGGGGGAGCADPDYVYCEDFEDGSASGWTESGGTWQVLSEDDNFAVEGGGGSQRFMAPSGSWTDQIVEARVQILEFGGTGDEHRAGIIARFTDPSTYYALALTEDGNLSLLKATSSLGGSSGTCDPISVGVDPFAWFDLRIEATGPAGNVRVRTFLNDTPMHDCTTTSNTSGAGTVGVLTRGSGTTAMFDDIRVSTP